MTILKDWNPEDLAEQVEQAGRLDRALRGLLGTLSVQTFSGKRTVAIPSTSAFWEAYDEAKVLLE